MKVALVFNPFKYKVHEENLRVVQKYFGLFPPLSLAWVAAIVEQAGHEAVIIDARTRDLSMEETWRELERFKPDVLGFMMTTYMFRDTLGWIRYLKNKMSHVYVMIGGYNLRVYPEESLTYPEIDFGIVEHAFYTVPALLRELEKKSPDFHAVPGLAYKQNGKVYVTDHPQKIEFEKYPFPARHLLPNHLYAEFPTKRRNFTVMVTSLGCPYTCEFCEAGQTAFNPRSPETVVAEIEECYEKYAIREIDIFDYNFTIDKRRVEKICDLIIEKKIDVLWACRSRIDTVDERLLRKMRQAGCDRIYFGIESGAQEMLERMKKEIRLSDIEKTIRLCKKLGIDTLGFFLVGAPGETRETFRQTLRFAKKLNCDYAQFSKCLAKPLTPLWREMCDSERRDYWADWIKGEDEDRELPRRWTVLTNDEIDSLARKAYLSYYTRPAYLLRQVLKLRSFKEFKRKVSAFLSMMLTQEKKATVDIAFKAYNENK